MTIIHALIQVFSMVFRSVATTILQFISIIVGALGAAALVGFLCLSAAGVVGVRLSRRRAKDRS